MGKLSQRFRLNHPVLYSSFTLHCLGGDANVDFRLLSYNSYCRFTVTSHLSCLQCEFRRPSVFPLRTPFYETLTHMIYTGLCSSIRPFVFQAWPKQRIATAKTKHALSRQSRACAAHNGCGFTMPQICRICAFHDYVNFHFRD